MSDMGYKCPICRGRCDYNNPTRSNDYKAQIVCRECGFEMRYPNGVRTLLETWRLVGGQVPNGG